MKQFIFPFPFFFFALRTGNKSVSVMRIWNATTHYIPENIKDWLHSFFIPLLSLGEKSKVENSSYTQSSVVVNTYVGV